jgi:DNA-binding response OmpR family regulator
MRPVIDGERPRIAVIDDEQSIRDVLEVGLAQEGFDVRSAADGMSGLELVRSWHPSGIVLDVMMPKVDGLALLPMLRRITEVPIVMLTARGEIRDRIEGLRSGADDYLAKPFDLGELAARLQSALRRPRLERPTHLRAGDVTVDMDAREVRRGKRVIDLSPREFDLLATLARRPNRVFTRDELLDLVWGADRDVMANTVETYVSYVRSKVDAAGDQPLIQTVRGVGYVIRDR